MTCKNDDDSIRRAVALKTVIDPWVTSARNTIVTQAVSIRETCLERYAHSESIAHEDLVVTVDTVIADMLDIVGEAVYSEPIVSFVLDNHYLTLRELYFDQINT